MCVRIAVHRHSVETAVDKCKKTRVNSRRDDALFYET